MKELRTIEKLRNRTVQAKGILNEVLQMYNEIEGIRFETVEQIGVMEKETAFGFVLVPAELKLEAGGVGLGNFACGGGVVGGVDLSAGQFLREGKRDGPGAGADVGDLGIL